MVLDEAHTIKSPKSQISMAAAALAADCRWCLTGTPIQVSDYCLLVVSTTICSVNNFNVISVFTFHSYVFYILFIGILILLRTFFSP